MGSTSNNTSNNVFNYLIDIWVAPTSVVPIVTLNCTVSLIRLSLTPIEIICSLIKNYFCCKRSFSEHKISMKLTPSSRRALAFTFWKNNQIFFANSFANHLYSSFYFSVSFTSFSLFYLTLSNNLSKVLTLKKLLYCKRNYALISVT